MSDDVLSQAPRPELPEREPTQMAVPFARLRQRLAERGFASEPEPEREAYVSHRQFEVERSHMPDGYTRFAQPTSCTGMMRIIERRGVHLELECDGCGAAWMTRMPAGQMTDYLLEQAAIPEHFAGKEFDKTDAAQQPTLIACRQYVQTFKREPLPAIALWGQAGRGKTHLLSLMVETLIRRHQVEAVYRSVIPLLHDLRDAVREGTFESAYRRLINVPVLALDDLGAERLTDAAQEWLAGLVDHRYAKELPMLVATNVPPQAWPERFGERAASRLRGVCLPFRLEGPDRREQGVQETLAMAGS